MDKTGRTEYYRAFLLEALPEPLTRASAHIQIFDNYVANTRMRLRSIRHPESKQWTRILQQRVEMNHETNGAIKVSEIYLNDDEHGRFEIFEGTEIRKNRYFHEVDGRMTAFDVYLGSLWGLNMALVEFTSPVEQRIYEPPPFAVFEVTGDPFFRGENLVYKNFEDVQAEVAELGKNVPPPMDLMDE